MSIMTEGLLALGALVILIAWYFLGKMDNVIGLIFRVIWNFWFRLFSIIPFLGWTSRFIITMNEKDEIEKEKFQEKASILRQENADKFVAYTERRSVEVAASEAKWKAQQQQKQKEDQDWVRKQAWQKDGRTDVEFSRDGTRWKYQDESWDNSKSV